MLAVDVDHDDAQIPERADLAAQIIAGDRSAIARALNLIEDCRPNQRKLAQELLRTLSGRAASAATHRIGMTGPPGVGKSSLANVLIDNWLGRGRSVGVLAIDPSSPVSGGALLGDRIRIRRSGTDARLFVRSLASRGQEGGLSAVAYPMSLVLAAAFDIVLIETVGVGQNEVDIASVADTTLLVIQPASGDSIQFLKAGIMEIPHLVVVNKADLGGVAQRTFNDLSAALAELPRDPGWQRTVSSLSAQSGQGVAALVTALGAHFDWLGEAGVLDDERDRQGMAYCEKAILSEFGRFGWEQIGGKAGLKRQFESSDRVSVVALEALRQILLGRLARP